MVRNVIAEETLLSYLQNLGNSENCSIGLILGQPTISRDYVIHFARTPQPAKKNISEEEVVPAIETAKATKEAAAANKLNRKQISTFSEIPESWVGDHAKHATRMLPGGMYVLGIFITSSEDLFTTHTSRIKSLLSQMNKQLSFNSYLRGISTAMTDKLVLIYNPKTMNYVCRTIEVKTGALKPVEFKFMSKPTKWHQLECNFQFDQNIPITNSKMHWNLKRHLQSILETVQTTLQSGIVMIDGEIKDRDETLESLGKKKKNAKTKGNTRDVIDSRTMQVNMFLPCVANADNEDPKIIDCSGDMHFIGQLASRVFLHQKATINEANNAVKDDIIRSLAARLEMHWDSLLEEETMSPEEKCSVHEPPRRVLVPLPASRVTLSDYLFPGEGPSEALISLEELLDLSVKEEDVIKDLEVQADPADFYSLEEHIDQTGSDEVLPMSSDTNKLIYYVGLIVALVVLAVSLFIHFLKQPF